MSKDFLNDFIRQASKLLPSEQSREDLQKSLQILVQSSLAKLDVVTREEFDAQQQVLAQTRARLEQLEQQLEQFLQPNKD